MKLQKENIQISSSGATSTRRFSIEGSAQAFAVLSSTIYEDKIKAPIRELSTNAYDAHVEAGCADRPFDVHLPNNIDSEFRVRDYGCSMSHEEVMNLYTTYFASNKRDSNELNGCLGLGSKSPFAYTNQFWITTYRDGISRNYVATVDADGSRLDEFPAKETTEENGTEIGFTVKEGDFYRFASKAEELYAYFKTVPNVTGVDFNIQEKSYILTGEDWRFANDNRYSYAIMGNVAYRLDLDNIFDEGLSWHERRSLPEYKILYAGLEIDFNIGELQMSASREGLEYTDRVREAILNKVTKVVEDIRSQINDNFASCDTMWEARHVFRECSGYMKSLFDHVEPTFEGEAITSEWQIPTSIKVHRFKMDGHVCKMKREVAKMFFNQSSKPVIILNDLKTGAQPRVRHFIHTENSNVLAAYLVQGSEENIAEALESLGVEKEEEFVLASTLPSPPKVTRAGGKRQSTSFRNLVVFSERGVGRSRDSLYWEDARVDWKDDTVTRIYVEISRWVPKCKYCTINIRLKTLWNKMTNVRKVLGYTDELEIYGVKTAKIHQYENATNWISLKEYIEELQQEILLNNQDVVDGIMASKKSKLAKRLNQAIEISTVELADGYAKSFAEAHNLDKARIEDLQLCDFLSTVLYTGFMDDIEAKEDTLKEFYPALGLIQFFMRSHADFDVESANMLIKSVNDSQAERKNF
jgi:hypothetical protein